MSITCIENLSNEIFYEIFDYLNGLDTLNAFLNLNYRFQQFLHCSFFLYKINVDSTSDEEFMNYSKQVKLLNKHQIFSLNLSSSSHIKKFFSAFIIDSSLNRLESITLRFIKEKTLILLLNNLTCLPRLFSLNIKGHEKLIDLNDIYRLIFVLNSLKYLKVTLIDWFYLDSLPIATTNQQFSPVKYLIIDHRCTFKQLAVLLSYTPELCYLYFDQEPVRNSNLEAILSITLSNLRYLSMVITYLDYDEFEILMKRISSKLKVFHVTIRYDSVLYLVSILWERLILQHIPELKKFYLKFYESTDDEDQSGDYPWPDNQFTSSFWIERQWIFEAEIASDEIIYFIYPYKKTWYESARSDTNSTTVNSNSAILTISINLFDRFLKSLYKNIAWVTTVTTIYHLQFRQQQILIRILINIINFLPDLDSVKIWSLSLSKPKRLSWKEIQFINDITERNKITKVYLENMIKYKEVLSLIDLFPRIKYLQIGWTNNIDIEAFIRIILKKIINKSNHDFCSLCFCIRLADDEMVKKLQNIIDSNKILFDYTIKRVCDKIYLKWK